MLTPERHPALLDRASTALVLVDMQTAFRGSVARFDAVVERIALLLRGARLLDVPVVVSEQYPRGLGETVAELAELLPADTPRIEKLEFAVPEAAGWSTLPARVREAEQFVVAGIEAHVCVRQTALALRHAGRDVHVPSDGVGSRGAHERDVALAALAAEGVRLSSVEQVLFDWVATAAAPEFRDLQSLLKAAAAPR